LRRSGEIPALAFAVALAFAFAFAFAFLAVIPQRSGGICLRSKSKCNKISLSFHRDRRSRAVGKRETPFVFHLFHSSPGYLSSGLEDNLLHLDLESTLLLHLPLRVLLRETWLPSRPLR
jgi:hypothetical protein